MLSARTSFSILEMEDIGVGGFDLSGLNMADPQELFRKKMV